MATQEQLAALVQFLRANGSTDEEIQAAIDKQIAQGAQLEQNRAYSERMARPTLWENIKKVVADPESALVEPMAGAIVRHISGPPPLPTNVPIGRGAAPALPGKSVTSYTVPPAPPPPEVKAEEPTPEDPFYEDPYQFEAGRAWGGGGYTPVPGTRIVGGATIPGSGFPSLTGGPIFVGNTPEIAKRAALAGLTKETPTGVESRGAFSPGRRPDTYLSKSWEEVANTESPLIQDLWQENFNKQRANQLMEAGARTQLAQARIAEQQAAEAEMPWSEQMQRLVDRQMAVAKAILQQEMPNILARVESQIQMMAQAAQREGKPLPPEYLEIAKRNALEKEKQIVLAQWMTQLYPQTLQNFYRSAGLANPFVAGGLGGGAMGDMTGGNSGG